MRMVFFTLAVLLAQVAAAQQRYRETHAAMGTVFTLELYARDESTAAQLSQEAFDVIDRVDDELSNYKPSSELSRISRYAGATAVTTDPETFTFLERSLYWSEVSQGAFDITVGPLLRAWGFFFHDGRVPSDKELAILRDEVDWRKIILDWTARTVQFPEGEPLDLDPG